MSRFRRQRLIIKHIIMLVAIPLAVTGTGYAAFTQTLNTNGTGTLPGYTATQNLSLSYSISSAPSGQVLLYTVNPITVKYNGTGQITAWQVKFDLPSGFSNQTCTNATCTMSGNTLTAVNTGTNGTINPGGTQTFSATFKYATAKYMLQNMNVSGTLAPVWQTFSGLTVNPVRGTPVKSGSKWNIPYTITVTNSSGSNLSAWRIQAAWASTVTVQTMPATVTYTTTTSQISIFSKAVLNNGSNFVFSPTFQATTQTWALTSVTIQGSL